MSKYYAVKKGRNTGLFDTWEECEKQVKGYPGALYKSFKSREDALDYLNNKHIISRIKKGALRGLNAYIDGSFNSDRGVYGYGCILIYDDHVIEKLSGSDSDETYVSMRNVAGELMGVKMAIDYAIEHGYSSLTLYYDYEGIEKWANHEWCANKIGTKQYVEMIDAYNKKIDLHFIKVDAHTGVYYNEMADKLAKKAVGIIE